MRVDKAAVGLVKGIGGDAVVFVELFADGGGEAGDETLDFGLGGLVAGDGVGAREAGDPLAKGVAGDVAGHVFGGGEEAGGGGWPGSWRKGLRMPSSLRLRKRAWFCWNWTSMGPSRSCTSL